MTQNKKNPPVRTTTQQEVPLPLKGLFYLVGQHDAGKSTTLGWLAFSLAYDGLTEDEIFEKFERFRLQRVADRKNHQDAFPDMRVIVPYNGIYVYITLYGDEEEPIALNVEFFEGRLHNSTIYIFCEGKLRNLKPNEREYHTLYPPSVCISACHYYKGKEKPLKQFMDKMLLHTWISSWVYIPRTPDKEWKATGAGAFRRKYEAFAGRLKRMTDECLIYNRTIKITKL